MFDLDTMHCLFDEDDNRCWVSTAQILWALIDHLGLEISVKKSKSGHHNIVFMIDQIPDTTPSGGNGDKTYE